MPHAKSIKFLRTAVRWFVVISFGLVLVCWFRSHMVLDKIVYDHWYFRNLTLHRHSAVLVSANGRIVVLLEARRAASARAADAAYARPPRFYWDAEAVARGASPLINYVGVHHRLGFSAEIVNTSRPYNESELTVMVPYWAVLACIYLYPLWLGLHSLRRSLRRRRGYCIGCGYDLCATADRCPECGELRA